MRFWLSLETHTVSFLLFRRGIFSSPIRFIAKTFASSKDCSLLLCSTRLYSPLSPILFYPLPPPSLCVSLSLSLSVSVSLSICLSVSLCLSVLLSVSLSLSVCLSLSVFLFLVADTQLYKRLCPSVCPSVHPSVGVNELKSGKTSVLDTFCVCLSVGGGLGCGWGLDAPVHSSATIL